MTILVLNETLKKQYVLQSYPIFSTLESLRFGVLRYDEVSPNMFDAKHIDYVDEAEVAVREHMIRFATVDGQV